MIDGIFSPVVEINFVGSGISSDQPVHGVTTCSWRGGVSRIARKS